MELFSYLCVLVLSLVFSLRSRLIGDERLFFLFFILVYMSQSLVVRFSGYDSDIITYASSMSYGVDSVYYLKEPVVWYGQRYLYSLIGDASLVFLLCDLVMGLALYYSLKVARCPQYLFFAILVFFPFILGFQNIYRQWVSSIFLLTSIVVMKNRGDGLGRSSVFIFYFLSVASHNVALLFSPLVFIMGRSFLLKVIGLISLLVVPVGLFVFKDAKSSGATGGDLSVMYLILTLMIVFSFIVMEGFKLKKSFSTDFFSSLAIFYIVLAACVILSSLAAERIAMFGLIILYVFLAVKAELSFKQIFFARMSFVILGFFPLLFFPTRSFIL